MFPMLPDNTSDPSQLSCVDVEAFVIALMQNVQSSVLSLLPACQEVVTRVDQRAFWHAAVMLHNNEAMKSNLAMLRKTVKSGKNLIRLNGAQPACEIVAAIGEYLTHTGRPNDAIRYLESIEHHLSATSRGKAIVASSGSVTLLGSSVEPMSSEDATSYLGTLSFANGAKSAAGGLINEAVSFYESAGTAESMISAALLLKETGCDGEEEQSQFHFDKAAELCVKARTLKPDSARISALAELEDELANLTADIVEVSLEGTENGHDQTAESANDTVNNSVYSTPMVKSTSRHRSYSAKEFQEVTNSMKKMIENHENITAEQGRVLTELGKDVRSNSENIRQLTVLLSSMLVAAPPVMMAPPPIQHQMVSQPPPPVPVEQFIAPPPAQILPVHHGMGHPGTMPVPIQQMAGPMIAPRPMMPQVSARPPLVRPSFPSAPPPVPQVSAAPIPAFTTPEKEPKTDAPVFVFKPKDAPAKAINAADPSVGSFFSSTPSRGNNGHKFVFKSPEQADVENAKLEEDEKNEEDNAGEQGPHFEPLIALPDLIEVKTGEEDEEVAFCARGKLYRWVNTEWKERGLGDIKILKNTKTGRSRVVMRREQVLKICANHLITDVMKLSPMAGKDTAWIWHAMDASPEEINEGTLTIIVKGDAEAFQHELSIIPVLYWIYSLSYLINI